MTTGKTKALTRQIFVGKVMSLLFNMLSRLVIAFLPRNKRLLISWLQAPSAVILEPSQVKSITVYIVSPSICHEVIGLDAMISVFFVVQLSYPYMTTGKTVALTSWTFVGKVMSLLFNMLSKFLITFLPKSKCLLISWLQSPSAVILESPKNKV